MSEFIIEGGNLGKLRRLAGLHVKETLEMTSGKVTRCRDCKHFTPKGTHKFGDNKVNADYCKYIRSYMLRVTPDGFCAWGVRRDA